MGYPRQKSGHQLSKNSHIEILTSDLVLFIKVWIVFSQRSFKLQFFYTGSGFVVFKLKPQLVFLAKQNKGKLHFVDEEYEFGRSSRDK